MNGDLVNITQSRCYQDRIFFEVDSRRITQQLIDDLAERLQALIQSEEEGHFFDQGFEGFAHVAAVTNPLKFQVTRSHCAQPMCCCKHNKSKHACHARVTLMCSSVTCMPGSVHVYICKCCHCDVASVQSCQRLQLW